MKKTIILLFTLLASLWGWADSITWMEKTQAEALMMQLRSEKYLFFYCDCCDLDGADLVQIADLSIEPSDVVDGLFSVRVKGTKVMSLSSDVNGNFSEPSFDGEEFSDYASLNYSMIPMNGRAMPLGNILNISSEDIGSCLDFTYFPNPNEEELFDMLSSFPVFKTYQAWYEQHISPFLGSQNLFGTWTVVEICLKYGECKEITPDMGSVQLSFETNGVAFFSADAERREGKWKVEDGILYVTADNGVVDRFGFRFDGNALILRDMKRSYDTGEDVPFTLMKLRK